MNFLISILLITTVIAFHATDHDKKVCEANLEECQQKIAECYDSEKRK